MQPFLFLPVSSSFSFPILFLSVTLPSTSSVYSFISPFLIPSPSLILLFVILSIPGLTFSSYFFCSSFFPPLSGFLLPDLFHSALLLFSLLFSSFASLVSSLHPSPFTSSLFPFYFPFALCPIFPSYSSLFSVFSCLLRLCPVLSSSFPQLSLLFSLMPSPFLLLLLVFIFFIPSIFLFLVHFPSLFFFPLLFLCLLFSTSLIFPFYFSL